MGILDKFKKKKEKTESVVVESSAASGPAEKRGRTPLILKKPWITEKTVSLGKLGKYTFSVLRNSSAWQIKNEIESIYKVKVKSINMINIKGKRRRLGQRAGKIPGVRKAIVTLEKGHNLDILPR